MHIHTSVIKLDVKNIKVNAYLASPENGGPGILVLHAWWGLKPFFKELCDRLAEQGYVVLAPDLMNGEIATTIDEAKVLVGKSVEEFVHQVVMAAKDHLLSLSQRKGKTIGVIGFSFGAAWSLVIAENAAEEVSSVVLFYGAYAVDFSLVKAKILGHYAEVDEWEPLEGVKAMEADMQAAGVDATLHVYPKVVHWFVESDRPEFDPVSAQLAWDRTFEFLKNNLR